MRPTRWTSRGRVLEPAIDRWRLFCFTALFVAIPGLGCDQQDTPPDGSTRVLVDRLGRSVDASASAQRIVSLSPASTELLFAIGLEQSIVGVTQHCNYPPAALEIHRVGGGTTESTSIEAIVAAKPDLVLCNFDAHGQMIDALDRLQIRSFAIGAQSLDGLFEDALKVGQLTDHQTEAEAFVLQMKNRRRKLISIVAKASPTPPLRFYYEVWDDPLMTVGPGSFIDEIFSLAGLENILRDSNVHYPRISGETVIRENPDVIFLARISSEEDRVSRIRSRSAWDGIKAIQQDRIHLISGDPISRPGPRLLDALSEIILAAYPDVSADQVAP